eukprot:9985719-Alexandrium_andersonii.AAC.1
MRSRALRGSSRNPLRSCNRFAAISRSPRGCQAPTPATTVSRVSYTPTASRITSVDEAGGQLSSEVSSLDPESSDDAAENATEDPYEGAAAVLE